MSLVLKAQHSFGVSACIKPSNRTLFWPNNNNVMWVVKSVNVWIDFPWTRWHPLPITQSHCWFNPLYRNGISHLLTSSWKTCHPLKHPPHVWELLCCAVICHCIITFCIERIRERINYSERLQAVKPRRRRVGQPAHALVQRGRFTRWIGVRNELRC